MSTLTVTTTYDDGQVLTEAQIDALKTQVESFYNNANVDDGNIQANSLDASRVIANSAVTTAKLTSNSVTSTKLKDYTVSDGAGIATAKIIDDAVTTAKIATGAITTAKINDSAVTAAKITNNAVPASIMPSHPTASSTFTDLTVTIPFHDPSLTDGSENLVGTMTFSGLTSGKPIILSLQSTSTATGYGYIELVYRGLTYGYMSGPLYGYRSSTSRAECAIILKKDGTQVSEQRYALGDVYKDTLYFRVPLSSFTHVDVATATSHVYTIYIKYIGVDIHNYDGDWSASFGAASTPCTVAINSAKLVGIQVV